MICHHCCVCYLYFHLLPYNLPTLLPNYTDTLVPFKTRILASNIAINSTCMKSISRCCSCSPSCLRCCSQCMRARVQAPHRSEAMASRSAGICCRNDATWWQSWSLLKSSFSEILFAVHFTRIGQTGLGCRGVFQTYTNIVNRMASRTSKIILIHNAPRQKEPYQLHGGGVFRFFRSCDISI